MPLQKRRGFILLLQLVSTVRTIWQSKQEVRDKCASYARLSILRYFSECQRIVPADAPFVPPRDEQGGPELVEEPAAEIILPREAQRVISITHKNIRCKKEEGSF
jgi:hypothetical protein